MTAERCATGSGSSFPASRGLHPFAEYRPVTDGVRPKREVVASLRDRADLVIDTSHLNAAELKRLLAGDFSQKATDLRGFVTSGAYRQGQPRNPDLVLTRAFSPTRVMPHISNKTLALSRFCGAMRRKARPIWQSASAAPAARITRFMSPNGWSRNRAAESRGRIARRVVASRSRHALLLGADPSGCADACELRTAGRPGRGI